MESKVNALDALRQEERPTSKGMPSVTVVEGCGVQISARLVSAGSAFRHAD